MKSLINSALLKEQLKRFFSISAFSFLAYGLLVLIPMFQKISYGIGGVAWTIHDFIDLISMKNPTVIISNVLIPLVVVISTFSYLFQSKSTTAMHAYPLSKNQLFFTNVLSGMILMAIPLMLLCCGVVIFMQGYSVIPSGHTLGLLGEISLDYPRELFQNGIQAGDVLNITPLVVGFFFKTMLSFAFYYAVFLLAAMVTGSRIIHVLLSGVLTLIPAGLLMLGLLIGQYYFFGFDQNGIMQLLDNTLLMANPVAFSTLYRYSDTDAASNLALFVTGYLVIMLVLFGISCWCNHIRKQERASDTIVFYPIKNVLIFLLSIFGMILLGSFFLAIYGSSALMYFGFALGFIITYFIAQMIAEKSFNVFKSKAKDIFKFGGVAGSLFVIVMLVVQLDLIGYTTFVPKQEDIVGVSLNSTALLQDETSTLSNPFMLTDPEIIAQTLLLHQNILDNRVGLRNDVLTNNRAIEFGIFQRYGTTTSEDSTVYRSVVYHLKNGKLVFREYHLPHTFAKESGQNDLLSKEEIILYNYPSFRAQNKIERIGMTIVPDTKEGSKFLVDITNAEEIASLLPEIKKDVITESRLYINNPNKWESAAEDSLYIRGNIVFRKDGKRSYEDHFDIQYSDKTKQWLTEHGYLQSDDVN